MWLTRLQEQLGKEVTTEQLTDFIWKTLKSGQVKYRETKKYNNVHFCGSIIVKNPVFLNVVYISLSILPPPSLSLSPFYLLSPFLSLSLPPPPPPPMHRLFLVSAMLYCVRQTLTTCARESLPRSTSRTILYSDWSVSYTRSPPRS